MITREMNDELLLVILFLGLRRLLGSLVFSGTSRALPSPKAGADVAVADVDGPPSLIDVPRPSPSLLSLASLEYRPSLGCSAMLGDSVVVVGVSLKRAGGGVRLSKLRRDTLLPVVAGCGVVAKGLGFITGASEG